jgi:hypothetical protein
MRILLDECLPRQLKRELVGHDVLTVPQMGWASKKNGELLSLMADEFEVFITFDKSPGYQQNLTGMKIGYVVLKALRNNMEHLQPLMPQVRSVLETIQPGDLVEIKAEM